ncbi:hypothetical protein AG1IA_05998 [Rhizoctonia solani AG-1 IA]|uniref:Uncharacterized protein n=1 Tax=Thanatephorus cucumeris (strain AG1-IA) TaxID=983506 RepID=L8WP87_THACA|nr:hypothetical protein AG1IA_05998 [Rhizoctonia solani AG-1 IA]
MSGLVHTECRAHESWCGPPSLLRSRGDSLAFTALGLVADEDEQEWVYALD